MDYMVSLFQGSALAGGLRLVDQSRDAELADLVRDWFAAQKRGDAARLEGDEPPHLQAVPEDDPGSSAA